MSSGNTSAELNDMLRTTFRTGPVILAKGIASLSEKDRDAIIIRVRQFTQFSKNTDPYGLHEFGAFEYANIGKIFWRIDCYDCDYRNFSSDPANPAITRRVLTIMLAEEYKSWSRDFRLIVSAGISGSSVRRKIGTPSIIWKFKHWVSRTYWRRRLHHDQKNKGF